MTLTYFTARSAEVDHACEWIMSLEGQNLQLIGKWTEYLWF